VSLYGKGISNALLLLVDTAIGYMLPTDSEISLGFSKLLLYPKICHLQSKPTDHYYQSSCGAMQEALRKRRDVQRIKEATIIAYLGPP